MISKDVKRNIWIKDDNSFNALTKEKGNNAAFLGDPLFYQGILFSDHMFRTNLDSNLKTGHSSTKIHIPDFSGVVFCFLATLRH